MALALIFHCWHKTLAFKKENIEKIEVITDWLVISITKQQEVIRNRFQFYSQEIPPTQLPTPIFLI